MFKKIENNGLIWNYIQKPTKKDWEFIENNLKVPGNVLLEMIETLQYPCIERYNGGLYININIPLFNRIKQTTEAGNLHIIVNETSITTIIFKVNIPVKSIFHHCEKSKRFSNELLAVDGGMMMIRFLDELATMSFDKIKHINENIDWVKETISTNDNRNNVQEISKIKLDILMFQRVLKPQKNIMETMLKERYELLATTEKRSSIRQLIRTNIKVWNTIESAQEIIESLEITNNSMVSFKLNNTMRFLAAVSLITFTMSVTLGVFSIIPFASLSIASEPGMFWLVMLLLIIILIFSIILFRRKRWF